MATLTVPPRTPSPKVRIRSLSFDSPPARMSITPVEESPFSKSTGSLRTLESYDGIENITTGGFRPANVLLPLNTKMSDESILSDTSSVSSSVTSSPSNSEGSNTMQLCTEEEEGEATEEEKSAASSPLPLQDQRQRQRQRPHPLAFSQTALAKDEAVAAPGPTSPFLYQDTSCPMYSPWLVRVVLNIYDVHRLDWMSIAELIERVWGVRSSSADVLGILSDNGRVLNRRWWD
ncbi:hypothetical protein DDE83_002068 [Stemphylium lycopersici]|uniref:Uncharacterized protein n=1 Tax=Stemphylium lycopersici TaxID=183478 RepID=A0A364NB53_STELY|nr:hypothetical protein DDE83_002068 [Stemphylium lycopersici]